MTRQKSLKNAHKSTKKNKNERKKRNLVFTHIYISYGKCPTERDWRIFSKYALKCIQHQRFIYNIHGQFTLLNGFTLPRKKENYFPTVCQLIKAAHQHEMKKFFVCLAKHFIIYDESETRKNVIWFCFVYGRHIFSTFKSLILNIELVAWVD